MRTRLPIREFCVYSFPPVVDESASPKLQRTFWQSRVVDPMIVQLTQGITPEKIALTIAVGSALALFPMLGVTTLFCFLAGIILRLNQPIIQVVNYLCTPIHLTAIYYCWQWGDRLFGLPHPRMRIRETAELMWHLLLNDPALLFQRFGMLVFHASVVWAIAAPIWVTVMYYTSRTTLREVARLRAEAAAKALASQANDPKNHPVP
jgi:uncharacterized protein (DUF2062 family)